MTAPFRLSSESAQRPIQSCPDRTYDQIMNAEDTASRRNDMAEMVLGRAIGAAVQPLRERASLPVRMLSSIMERMEQADVHFRKEDRHVIIGLNGGGASNDQFIAL
jgi:hypothetical protein